MKNTKWLLIILAILMVGAVLFAACTTDQTNDPADTKESTTEEATSEPSTDALADETTQEPATQEPTTEEQTTTNEFNDPVSATHITFTGQESFNWKKMLTEANQCGFEIVKDEECGYVLKLTTKSGASDPFICFNYNNYVKKFDMSAASADDYKYVVLKIKAENVTSDAFEMFYAAGTNKNYVAGLSKVAVFDMAESGWQYLVFDLSAADWTGDIRLFRFDFLVAPSGGDESVYIASVDLYRTAEEAYGNMNIDMTRPGQDSDLKETPVSGVNYDKLTAPQEDASVLMWFDHMTEKTFRDDILPSALNTYVIHMAGNSIENCQIFVAPTASDRNIRIEISDMVNEQGNVLKTQLLREHYAKVGNDWMPDALPPVNGSVSVAKSTSQGFVLKVWADAQEPAGLYSATVNIYDADTGDCIKTANVYTKIYDFSLDEKTALKTAIGMSPWSVYASYLNKGMEDKSSEEIYKIYYDFMLENRISCYDLPYKLWDSRVTEYLDNPRVTSFSIGAVNGGDEAGAYEILSQKQEWLDKGYFYYVDEPTNVGLLNQLKTHGQKLAGTYPGYRMVSPFFTNLTIEGMDQISFMEPYTKIWCTKVFAFTPRAKSVISGAQFLTTKLQDEQYGSFAQRMAEQVAEGDELWLYFCWEPNQPYANWLVTGDGTEPIVTVWQCKMTDATGLLYWGTTYWSADPFNDLRSTVITSVYGDGVLLFSGAEIGSYEPVSSFRLENIRLGIQDYQMLVMLEERVSANAADEMVSMVTTDVITYTNDDDYLHAVRVLLVNKVAETYHK